MKQPDQPSAMRERFVAWFKKEYEYAPLWNEQTQTFVGTARRDWEIWQAAQIPSEGIEEVARRIAYWYAPNGGQENATHEIAEILREALGGGK
jgi:hypothetical protein